MSLIRLLFYSLLAYFAYKVVTNFVKSFDKKAEIKGTPKNKSTFNLNNHDVEDADFEEIDDE